MLLVLELVETFEQELEQRGEVVDVLCECESMSKVRHTLTSAHHIIAQTAQQNTHHRRSDEDVGIPKRHRRRQREPERC
jgi:hypothetical protein